MLASVEQSRAFLGALEVNNAPDLTIKLDGYHWRIHEKLISKKLATLKQDFDFASKPSSEWPLSQTIILSHDDPWIIARMIQFLYYGEHCSVPGDSTCPTAEGSSDIAPCCRNVSLGKMLEVGAKTKRFDEQAKADASRNAHEVYAKMFTMAQRYGIPDLRSYTASHLQDLSFEKEENFFNVMDLIGGAALYDEEALFSAMVAKVHDSYVANPADFPRFKTLLKEDLKVASLVVEHVQRKLQDSEQKYRDIQQKYDKVDQRCKELAISKAELENKHGGEILSLRAEIEELSEELAFRKATIKTPRIGETKCSHSDHDGTLQPVDGITSDIAPIQSSTANDTTNQHDTSTQVRAGINTDSQTLRLAVPPKRALSAFMFFANENRERTRSDNPNISFGEIGKLLGENWRGLSDKEKEKYQKMADEDKKRYESEKAVYDKRPEPQKPNESSTTVNASSGSVSAATDVEQKTQSSSINLLQPISFPDGAAKNRLRQETRVKFPPDDTNQSPFLDDAAASTQSRSPPLVKSPVLVLKNVKFETSSDAFSKNKAPSGPSPFFGTSDSQAPTTFGTDWSGFGKESSFSSPSSAAKPNSTTPSLFTSGSTELNQKSPTAQPDQSLLKPSPLFEGSATTGASPFLFASTDVESKSPSLFGSKPQTGSVSPLPTAGGIQPKPTSMFEQGGFGIFGSPSPPSTSAQPGTTTFSGFSFGNVSKSPKHTQSASPFGGSKFRSSPVGFRRPTAEDLPLFGVTAKKQQPARGSEESKAF